MSGAGEAAPCTVDVGRPADFPDGHVREVPIAPKAAGRPSKVLVSRIGGRLYCTGALCTHYRAPLINGAHRGAHIRCPLHCARFDLRTGDIEDYPGLDSLPTHDIEESDGAVRIRFDSDGVGGAVRQKAMYDGPVTGDADQGVVIVGGGAAGLCCAETLRQENYTGKITIVSDELWPPYDRPKLSKTLKPTPAGMHLRPMQFYVKYHIELMLDTKVTSIDGGTSTVHTSSGAALRFGHLVLATGGSPRRVDAPHVPRNVLYLRTPQHLEQIGRLVGGKRLLVIGTSFIGMELAALCTESGGAQSVTVVGPSQVPFARVFGERIGMAVKNLFESKGVQFRTGTSVAEFQSDAEGNLTGALLRGGEQLQADVCVVGIGVTPNTSLLRGVLELTERGHVPVDAGMRSTSRPDVYACGDIAAFPLTRFGDEAANVQHWQMALKHGRTAALTIVGKEEPVDSVPFFWSRLFGKSIRYAGYMRRPAASIVLHGDVEALDCAAYYVDGEGRLCAVASVGTSNKAAVQLAEAFKAGHLVTRQMVDRHQDDDWSDLLQAT